MIIFLKLIASKVNIRGLKVCFQILTICMVSFDGALRILFHDNFQKTLGKMLSYTPCLKIRHMIT